MTLFSKYTLLVLAASTFFVTLAAGQRVQVSSQRKEPLVEFFLTGGFGEEFKGHANIEIVPEGPSTTFRLEYPAENSARLSAGQYTVVVHTMGFLPKVERLVVEGKDVFMPIPLTVAPIESVEGENLSYALTGAIAESLRSDGLMWLRLVGVYNGINRVTKVDEKGSFVFDKVPPGRYVMMIFNKGVLKESRPVDMPAFGKNVSVE